MCSAGVWSLSRWLVLSSTLCCNSIIIAISVATLILLIQDPLIKAPTSDGCRVAVIERGEKKVNAQGEFRQPSLSDRADISRFMPQGERLAPDSGKYFQAGTGAVRKFERFDDGFDCWARPLHHARHRPPRDYSSQVSSSAWGRDNWYLRHSKRNRLDMTALYPTPIKPTMGTSTTLQTITGTT